MPNSWEHREHLLLETLRGISDSLNILLLNQSLIIERLANMSLDLTALAAAVANNTSVEQSAVTLIQGLAQELASAASSGDQAAVATLSAQLTNSASALAAAITANTPAAAPAAPAAPSSPVTPAT